jgi:hypothetical protein
MAYVRQLPLWLRYVFALGTAAILFAALVIFVHHNQQPLTETPASATPAELRTEQQQDKIVVEQQQAPHVTRLAAHSHGTAAVSSAVTRYMSFEVSRGFIAGPLDGHAMCAPDGGTAARQTFRCKVYAGQGAGRLMYPFDAVVQPTAQRVTYCQVVTSPLPSLPSPPVTAACR